MAKDVTGHDASTVLSTTFDAPKASKLVVTLVWQNITGGGLKTYNLNQSNTDAVNFPDPVPALPSGFNITLGSDSLTFEVLSPAKKFEHSFNGAASGGAISIDTKIIYSND